ncbi:DUF4160 domain-containing protein [Paracoccus sp. S-4012]|uniref:DUF4160 domain-containing protein n=1 Tax=Paracoccus sp. S-4012 TaxID=2665648 RepID=UPI0012AFF5B7|nr:DUF4160 domain-containing protein [Paracoccus sp. S-4012]MRX50746.1 DUF4160 domain-containing protein [Paracoccus sp. S-4012]
MPTVFRHGTDRFFFYSNEGDPREPVHVHVEGLGGRAKTWMRPDVAMASSAGYDRRRLAELLFVARGRRAEIERAWDEHFR